MPHKKLRMSAVLGGHFLLFVLGPSNIFVTNEFVQKTGVLDCSRAPGFYVDRSLFAASGDDDGDGIVACDDIGKLAVPFF